ncbi:glycoside hydrolase family 15 protein [Acidisphaera sp. L21]|uniref:glycoside hydrolase family 15 protein n=1 Tax=Acidisphaera sp. L21 TaxID=1641851 RepID=UPI00131E0804|nr:glycoside hydrolase family 15 protein [Acidisphaera sp. L21]
MTPPDRAIEDHGLIGDLRTSALIARDGAITFFCAPHFDSPSIFASLLDPDAGIFRIAPDDDELRMTQMYLPDTNVLLTRFMSSRGIAELTDLMPMDGAEGPQRIQRHLRIIRGAFTMEALCAPRFDYARGKHRLEPGGVFRPEGDGPVLRLSATVPLADKDGDLFARFDLKAGDSAGFLLEIDPPDDHSAFCKDVAERTFHETIEWWRHWSRRSLYVGRWRETVMRSALTLKLLTSRSHGAAIAAPTFGLPEQPGGARNWDYRYVWIRDASFTMYAFIRLGLTDEAEQFVDWIGDRVRACEGERLRVAYSLDGENDLPETELDMVGYAGSRPVRIGNAASDQFQLDIYGELMDAVYLANKYGRSTSYEDWSHIRTLIDWIGEHWQRPDSGIWEGRGERKHFLHSRLMCWVAVDRAVRLGQKRSLPAPFPEWNELRMRIHASIHEEFWRPDLKSFVQYPGADTPDGSMLLMPLVRFISPCDPRWLGTMDLIREHLVEDALVFRRAEQDRALDGLEGQEGSFLACSFWYVECLARGGEVAQARLLFEKLLGYASPLGLYAEELSPTGRHQGNFPQALTHLALISAASYLDRTLAGGRPPPWP